MSIGRIEMVDGVKKYVRYATLGGSGGVPVGDVKNISLEEGMDALTLKWSDPDNVVFNGETTAEWAGTKVIRKEGENPTSVDDGVLVTDSTVRNQYETDGFADSNVSNQVKYHYALFPYTTKNVYRMSDANRANGMLSEYPYDRILSNNTWAEISEASSLGIAKEIWNVGDGKDGFKIIGFDHDDLSDGSGKAGVTFITDGEQYDVRGYLDNRTGSTYYTYAQMNNLNNLINSVKGKMNTDIINLIKKVDKKYFTDYQTNSASIVSTELFLLSISEVVDNEWDSLIGNKYDYFISNDTKKWINSYWLRTIYNNGKPGAINASGQTTAYGRYQTGISVRFAFCI